MNIRKLRVLYTAVEKARRKAIHSSAEDWFKRFKKKPWYKAAVSGYVELTEQTGALLSDWQKEVLKLIEKERIFVKGNTEVEKEDVSQETKPKKKYRTDEYLDIRYNRVIVDDIRDKLIDLRTEYQSKLETLYQSIIAGKMAVGIATAMQSDHLPFNFNRYNTFVKDILKTKKIHWAKQVADSTERYVKAKLLYGYMRGLSSLDIAETIKKGTGFSIFRAEKIARTESMASCNMADYARFGANDDIIGYRWQCAGGPRSRDTHKTTDGQFRAKGQPFLVGGYKMLHPGDGSLGAPAKEIINCRCWLEPVFADEVDSLSAEERAAVNSSKGLAAHSGGGIAEKSVPKFTGKIDVSNKKLIESKLREFEQLVINEPVEYACIILKNGKCYHIKGQAAAVDVTVLGKALQGAIVSHDHPKNETEYSFSNEDIELFKKYQLSELHGFDYKYKYVLRKKGVSPKIQLLDLFNMSEEEYRHQLVYQMAQAGGMYYERIRRNKESR